MANKDKKHKANKQTKKIPALKNARLNHAMAKMAVFDWLMLGS